MRGDQNDGNNLRSNSALHHAPWTDCYDGWFLVHRIPFLGCCAETRLADLERLHWMDTIRNLGGVLQEDRCQHSNRPCRDYSGHLFPHPIRFDRRIPTAELGAD